jgi:hypothetical protein
VSMRFVAAAHDADEADVLYEALDKYAESIGLFSEGGSIGPMNHDDVIADSPLAVKLGWAADGGGSE